MALQRDPRQAAKQHLQVRPYPVISGVIVSDRTKTSGIRLTFTTSKPKGTEVRDKSADSIVLAQQDSTMAQQQYTLPSPTDALTISPSKYVYNKRKARNCTKCSHTSYYSHQFKRHLANVHGEFTSYICRWCKKQFETKQKLQRHLFLLHNGRSSYKCPIVNCSKYFPAKNAMQQHINGIHTKEIAFNCTKCDFKSYYRCSLLKHTASRHPEDSYVHTNSTSKQFMNIPIPKHEL